KPILYFQNVFGIIIAKTDARGFPDRRSYKVSFLFTDVGAERFTFAFTIKDSPDHFINVSLWGKEEYVKGHCSRFRIGDCVVIENPLVVTKDPEKEDKFCPSTPSFYRLLVTETHSAIRMCSDLETETRLLSLFHIPVKDSRDFYSLGDIIANGQGLDGNFINILAAVHSIGEPKCFTTSDGRNGQRLAIRLFDETLTSFPLICWDRETIQLLQTLTPVETVLFIVDARITLDAFLNSMVATATSKTVITINPDTTEANQLFSYAKELAESGALHEKDAKLSDNVPLESITDVLTVKQIKAKAQENSYTFYTYAFITTLGLDCSMSKVISSRCSKCRFQISDNGGTCTNTSCPSQGQPVENTPDFDLWVDISDHTGTLKACSLSGTVAEKTLGCTVLPSTKNFSGMRANILSCTLADPVELKQRMSAKAISVHHITGVLIAQLTMNVNQGTVGSDPVILATAGYDHTVRFWQAHSGICTRTVQHQDSQVNSLEVTPDRSMIAAAGYQHIRMYDLNSNNPNPVINYDGVSKNITSVGFHEDGRWMYTGGEDCMARIWDLRSRNLQCQRIFQVNAPINCVCLHPNQAELFVGDQSGVIHIWDLKTDHNEQLIPEPEVSVNSVHIDPDASYMAAVNSSGNCYVWNLAGGIGDEVTQLIPKTKIPAHKRYSLRCKFSPDSTLLATCSADQTCKIWRTSNFSLMTELSIKSNNPGETSRGWMWDCAFSGDSQYIVTASSDNLARLWCVETGEIKREYSGHQKAVVCLAFNDSVLG
ncbi:hypothetical protein NFI96_015188, partial [Prochilodus magdalenae]